MLLPFQPLSDFFTSIKEDQRIGPYHISLYTALLKCWQERAFEQPLSVFSKEVMPLCMIAGSNTYHRTIRELHAYGYIRYIPSYNHFLGSLVYFN
jgi:hypothetical protein